MPKVLISDDDPLVVAAFTREARRAGIEVISDTSSDRVMELAKTQKPDLIIMDVHQRVDGRVLLARLKRDLETRDIRVIILSGMEDQLTRLICLNLGAFDYEVKPFDVCFLRKISRILGLAPLKSTG